MSITTDRAVKHADRPVERRRSFGRRQSDLHALAAKHIEHGGGIWIGESLEMCTPIGTIARKYLDGKRLEKAMGVLLKDFNDEQQDIVWEVVNAHADAAFALGAAVGLQMVGAK